MGNIVILDGVPLPPRLKSLSGGAPIGPWRREIEGLKVGQVARFMLDGGMTAKVVRGRLTSMVACVKRKFPNREFATRQCVDEGVEYVGVWRLEDHVVPLAAE